jgi:hypothetical protein
VLAHPQLHVAPRHDPPAGRAHPVRARGVPPRTSTTTPGYPPSPLPRVPPDTSPT